MSSLPSFVRAWFGRFVIALLLVASLTVGGVVAVNLGIDQELQKFKQVNVTVAEEPPQAHAGNFLLIGSDTRQFVTDAAEEQAFGNPKVESGQRSDTIMVVHVDPSTKKILLVSFPRDLWVNIPGVGMSKINAAYNYGPQKIIDTINANFDVPVQHYLEVDFRSFQGIVDAVGGVTIYFPAPARDKKTGLVVAGFGAGCYRLGGKDALAYVRSRQYEYLENKRWKLEPTSDIGRIKRQQDFMRKLASEAAHQAVGSFTKAKQIADRALTKGLTKDTQLTRGDILGLLGAFLRIDPNDPNQLETQTFPFKDGPRQRGQAVLYPQVNEAAPLLARLRLFGPPASATTPPGVVPASVHVRVLNGTRTGGLAGTTISALQQAGFSPAGVGNVPAGGVGTEVRYRAGADAQAKLVQSYLGGVGKLVADASITGADVVVVVRSDFHGVVAPGASTTATAQSTAKSTARSTGTAGTGKPATAKGQTTTSAAPAAPGC